MTKRGIMAMAGCAGLALSATPATAAPCGVAQIAELPVTMQGMRAIVQTRINGDPAPFILDSGAFYSLISPPVAKARHLPLQPLPPTFTLRGIGGSTNAEVATVHRFTLAGVDLANIQFVVGGTDVGQTGLLGQNVLGLADVEYDLPGGMVRLMRPKSCGSTAMAYWTQGKPFFEIPIESKEAAHNHTIGTVTLDGAKLKAMFDTGATTVISLRAAARAGVKPGDPGVERDGWDSGIGRRVVQGWIAPFKLLEIGNEQLHNVRLRIADLGDADTDMLIGADYFISHRLYVSNAQQRIYFTYTGGRLFDTRAHVDPTSPSAVVVGGGEGAPPSDAEAYSRQGAVFQTQHDLPHAIEAYTHAIALAPKAAQYPRQRALAYLLNRRPVLAMDDLDTTLTLDPADTDARLIRAEVRLRAGSRDGAVTDLDDLTRRLPREARQRMRIAQLYGQADAFAAAIDQYGLWLATHHDDAHRSEALNGRCWVRALANIDLDAARDDCNAAVNAVPSNPSFLDSRGLVALRRGDAAAAIADFNAALAIDPKLAWTLYCRGLAERRLGQTDAATRDLAAATALDKRIAARAQHYGLS